MSKSPLPKQEYYLLKSVNKAGRDFALFAAGDRVAVAISGGKDSWALLKLLLARNTVARDKLELVAVHVIQPGETAEQMARLARAVTELGVEYVGERSEVCVEETELNCFRCAWTRRKALFLTAHRLGCNKVAFGHHADDCAETVLLNLVYHGRIETMAPRGEFFDGKLTIIRPLVYIPEKDIVRYMRTLDFTAYTCECVWADKSKRARMGELLRQIEQDYPKAKNNLFRAAMRDKMT